MATRRPGTVDAVNAAIDALPESERATWQLPLGGALAELEPEPDETAADRVAAMLDASLTDDRAYVKLQRVVGPNKYAWCEDYSVADFEAGGNKMIREKWGVGEYDVRLYGVHPTTAKFCVRASTRVTIIASKNDVDSVPSRQNSELAQALQMMAQTQQQILTALTEKPAPVDPMVQMSQMFGMMATMREAMGSPPQNQLKDIVGAMREMKEVSAEFAPKESSASDDPMSMLAPILGIVQASMQQKGGDQQAQQNAPAQIEFNQPAPDVHAPALASRGRPAQTSQPHATQGEQMDMATLALFGQFKRLMMLAQSGAAPQAGADLLYDKLPDEMIDLLESPEWFDLLAKLPMGVGADAVANRPWLTQARDLAVAMFLANDEAGDAAGGAVDQTPGA